MPLDYRMVRKEETVKGILRLMAEKLGNLSVPLVERYVRENPKDPAGYVALSLPLQRTDPAKGLAVLEQGRKACGEQSVFCHAEAMVLGAAGRNDEAIAALKKAIELDPINYESMLSLATMFNRREMHAEARKYWLMLIELDPTMYFAWFGLGRSAFQAGDFGRALKYMNSALFTMPEEGFDLVGNPITMTRGAYHCARMRAHLELGMVAEGLSDLQAAFSLNAANTVEEAGKFLTEKARAPERNLETCIAVAEKVLELDPMAAGNASFYIALASMYLIAERSQDIPALFERGIRAGQPRVKMLDLEGVLLGNAGMFVEAKEVYTELVILTGLDGYKQNLAAVSAALAGGNPEPEKSKKGGKEPKAVTPRRNDPCPCGSGKKFKKCHGSG